MVGCRASFVLLLSVIKAVIDRFHANEKFFGKSTKIACFFGKDMV